MRQNPSFSMTDVAELRRVVERHPWATLMSSTEEGLVASHYAMLLDDEHDDLTVVGHVGKPDDLVHALGERDLLIVFQGPHGYISPSWCGDVAAVPTWNYVSVHLTGVPEILTAQENLRVLDRLVEHFEKEVSRPRLLSERPNDAAFVERLERGTVGFRLTPTRIVAKRKLSQNRTPEVVETIIAELDGDGPYAQHELAAEMRRAADARMRASGS